MKTFLVVLTLITGLACISPLVDNGIRAINKGYIGVLEGDFLFSGEYYHLTDNPKIFRTHRKVKVWVKAESSNSLLWLTQEHWLQEIVVHIPQSEITEEVLEQFQGFSDDQLRQLVQEHSDSKGWAVKVGLRREGPLAINNIERSDVPAEISFFELLAQP